MKKLFYLFLIMWIPMSVNAALTFGAVNTDYVNYGSNTVVDNIDTKTVIMWLYRTGASTNQGYMDKGGALGTGWSFWGGGTTGGMQIQQDRATTGTNYETSTQPVTLNAWTFIAVTYDSAATPVVRMYSGTLTAAASELTAFSVSTNGSGAVSADAANNLAVGNFAGSTFAFQGRIGFAGLWNRVLTPEEIRAQQFMPHVTSGNVFFSCQGFNGVSTQTDHSGKQNSGTVTGATVSTGGLPIRVNGC